MIKSIFWKLVLLILPLVLITDLAVLFGSYLITYNATMNKCREDVREAALIAADYFETADVSVNDDLLDRAARFDSLCDIMGMAYIYTEALDPDKGCKTYLSIGYGKGALEEARESVNIGYVSNILYEEEIRAFTNDEVTFCFDDTEYGDTIVCYVPVKKNRSSDTSGEEKETFCIAGAEMSLSDAVSTVRTRFRYIMVMIIVTSVLIVFIIAFILKRKIQKPVTLISKKMVGFIHERGSEFLPLEIKGQDEFAKMADSFNSMAYEIDRYIKDISKLNREKAMQETELNIAREIQNGFLEPTSFHTESVNIHSCMQPARDVGGDLYDYRILSDGSICVIIADVSGKGVSAALFMANAITLLRQYAESGLSPSRIMVEYNNHLAKHNPNMMFITTFIGIYHPETGELVYSNAGHNPPYLLSDRLIEIESTFEAAAGIFEDEQYTERRIKMKPGDTLFLYTDGVPEAKSTDDSLYGDDRLKDTLSNNLQKPGEVILSSVLESVKAFSENAEQSDDITILTMTIPEIKKYSLKLEAKAENITVINDKLLSLDIEEDDLFTLRLIAEEMFVNICSYAYKDGNGMAEVLISQEGKKVTLVFTDSGIPFDPTKDIPDTENYDPDIDIGGLGRFLTFEIADEYSYQYKDGKNILTVIKNFG